MDRNLWDGYPADVVGELGSSGELSFPGQKTAADGLIFPLKEGMGRSPFGKHNFQRDG